VSGGAIGSPVTETRASDAAIESREIQFAHSASRVGSPETQPGVSRTPIGIVGHPTDGVTRPERLTGEPRRGVADHERIMGDRDEVSPTPSGLWETQPGVSRTPIGIVGHPTDGVTRPERFTGEPRRGVADPKRFTGERDEVSPTASGSRESDTSYRRPPDDRPKLEQRPSLSGRRRRLREGAHSKG
jgi:hypothetical protein